MQNSNGTLMQLAAFDVMDSHFGDKYATNYNLVKFVKNELTISRSADLCIPLDIIFIMKHNMDTKKFIALVSNSLFKLFIDDVLFFELSFSFLMKLNPVKKVNDSFINYYSLSFRLVIKISQRLFKIYHHLNYITLYSPAHVIVPVSVKALNVTIVPEAKDRFQIEVVLSYIASPIGFPRGRS